MNFRFHHICIQTNCYDDSLAFYKDILGFKVAKETPNFHNRHFNTWLKAPDFWIELQTEKKGERLLTLQSNTMGLVHFALAVDSVEAAYEYLQTKGYTHFKKKEGKEVYEVEGGKLFKVIAPEGTVIEVKEVSVGDKIG